jgi:hypothetical protein
MLFLSTTLGGSSRLQVFESLVYLVRENSQGLKIIFDYFQRNIIEPPNLVNIKDRHVRLIDMPPFDNNEIHNTG